ncbi:PepSY domain-containing protein [Streptomyces yaizuensis]|uniref:PepSY domain-containing protein n=1 Tax=Streptomyces yaizuensis TaxID=2989713 RepID=A0ABQ5NWI4_9ACTN|nr:PepSY domain-containing protein [Streptomyces sp. YSPA8]GLF94714.1 PepSY domain-containing protein [Streptomyces sp. YSPA8]
MKRKLIIATAVAALLTGGAVTAVTAAADDKPSKISSSTAVSTALKEQSGVVESVSLDDGAWEVEIADAKGASGADGADDADREVRVDAESGKVLGAERDDADDDDRDDRDDRDDVPVRDAKVDAKQAGAAAVDFRAGTVTDIEFDDGHWEVEIHAKDGAEHEVRVDAVTGKASASPSDD